MIKRGDTVRSKSSQLHYTALTSSNSDKIHLTNNRKNVEEYPTSLSHANLEVVNQLVDLPIEKIKTIRLFKGCEYLLKVNLPEYKTYVEKYIEDELYIEVHQARLSTIHSKFTLRFELIIPGVTAIIYMYVNMASIDYRLNNGTKQGENMNSIAERYANSVRGNFSQTVSPMEILFIRIKMVKEGGVPEGVYPDTLEQMEAKLKDLQNDLKNLLDADRQEALRQLYTERDRLKTVEEKRADVDKQIAALEAAKPE